MTCRPTISFLSNSHKSVPENELAPAWIKSHAYKIGLGLHGLAWAAFCGTLNGLECVQGGVARTDELFVLGMGVIATFAASTLLQNHARK